MPIQTADLEKSCLSLKHCGLVITNGTLGRSEKQVLSRVMAKHRNQTIASIDVNRSHLSIIGDMFPEGLTESAFVMFVNDKKKKQNGYAIHKGAFSSSNINWFISQGHSRQLDYQWLTIVPTLFTASGGSKTRPPTPKSSKEERKAARDKARKDAEKKREQADQAKAAGQSPEEAARDRERQRRREMEKEAEELISWDEDAEDIEEEAEGIEIEADYED